MAGFVQGHTTVSSLEKLTSRKEKIVPEAVRTKETFADECMVLLDHQRRLCFRKGYEPRALKQRPKHAAMIHIWGGISTRGPTLCSMAS